MAALEGGIHSLSATVRGAAMEEPRKTSPFCLRAKFQGRQMLYPVDTSKTKQVWVTETALGLRYDNCMRLVAIRIVMHPSFEWIILVVIAANSILLTVTLPSEELENARWVQAIDLVFLLVYFAEFGMKVIALGFLVGKDTYLKNAWNWLDFLVLVTNVVAVGSKASALRCVRLLRPLKTLNAIPGTRAIVQTLFSSLPQLGVLLGLAVFVLGMLAALGLHLFTDSSWQRCRDANMEIVDDRLCGGLHQCPVNSSCINSVRFGGSWSQLYDQAEVDYGVMGFGNIFQSSMTVFQCSTQEGWSEQMYRIIDSSSSLVAILFFLTTLILGAFFIMNLILAVLWNQYQACSDEVGGDDDSISQDSIGKIAEMHGEKYPGPSEDENGADQIAKSCGVDGMGSRSVRTSRFSASRQMTLNDMEEMDTVIVKRKTYRALAEEDIAGECVLLCDSLQELSRFCHKLELLMGEESKSMRNTSNVHLSISRHQARLRKFVLSPQFVHCINIVIVGNAVVLSLDGHPPYEFAVNIMVYCNTACTFIFAIEVTLKIIAHGPREYIKGYGDIFDFIITAISMTEYFLSSSNGAGFSSLRALRLLRMVKLARGYTSLRILLKVLVKATFMMAHFCFVSFLVVYIFTLLGMQLFGRGELGTPSTRPRLHFDNGLWSLITVYCIITGENWNEIMLTIGYRSGTFGLAIIFTLAVLVVGNLVLLNLFLAILGASFQNARETIQQEYQVRLKFLVNQCPIDKVREELGVLRKSKRNTPDIIDEYEQMNAAVKKKLHSESCIGDFRPMCLGIVTHPQFDNFIMVMIFIACVGLVFRTPSLDPNSTLAHVINGTNVFVSTIFFFEAVAKLAAFGVEQYFRVGWNWIDFILVVNSVVQFMFWASQTELSSEVGSLRVLRALRSLRPLRFISRNKGLRIVVNCLICSVPQIFNTVVLTFMVFLIFAIMSVNFFKGQLFYCDIDEQWLDQINTKQDCLHLGGQWVNQNSNFDNVFEAFYTLFQMSTTEGWTDIMIAVIDARGIDLQPRRDHNPVVAFFFLSWMFVGGLFMLNLFFGVIIDQYNVTKDGTEGGVLITNEQKRWVAVQKMVLRQVPSVVHPSSGGNRWRKMILSLVITKSFDNCIYFLLVVNTFIAVIYHAGQAEEFTLFMDVCQVVLGVLFVMESVLKITAYGPGAYFALAFNLFDFMLVLCTLIVLFAMAIGISKDSVYLCSSILVLRGMRLLHRLPRLRVMFVVTISVLPSIANVCGLVLLLTFIYACLGNNLFGKTYRDENTALGDFANFETFFHSIFLLLRVSTGEAWYELMFDCANEHPNCVKHQDFAHFKEHGSRTCGSILAYPFFVSYTLIVAFVVFNLFVGCVLDAFLEQHQDDELRLIREEHRMFFKLWAEANPCGRRLMRWENFIQLLLEVPVPIGFRNAFPKLCPMWQRIKTVQRFLLNSNMPTWKGQVHLRDCIILICSRCCYYTSNNGMEGMTSANITDNEVTRAFRARFPEFYPPLDPRHQDYILTNGCDPIHADGNLANDVAYNIISNAVRRIIRNKRNRQNHKDTNSQEAGEKRKCVSIDMTANDDIYDQMNPALKMDIGGIASTFQKMPKDVGAMVPSNVHADKQPASPPIEHAFQVQKSEAGGQINIKSSTSIDVSISSSESIDLSISSISSDLSSSFDSGFNSDSFSVSSSDVILSDSSSGTLTDSMALRTPRCETGGSPERKLRGERPSMDIPLKAHLYPKPSGNSAGSPNPSRDPPSSYPPRHRNLARPPSKPEAYEVQPQVRIPTKRPGGKEQTKSSRIPTNRPGGKEQPKLPRIPTNLPGEKEQTKSPRIPPNRPGGKEQTKSPRMPTNQPGGKEQMKSPRI